MLSCAALCATLLGCSEHESSNDALPDQLDALSPNGAEPSELRLGMPPSSGNNSAAVLAPLVSYLSAELGMPVHAVTSTDYDSLAEMMRTKRVEVAVFSPLSYVRARASEPHGVPLALVTRGGSPTYLGYLVVRADDDARQIGELRGKRVAWVSRSSASGYLYPRALLRHKVLRPGESPDDFFAPNPLFAGDHRSALLHLVRGDVDVAAVAGPFVDPGPFNPMLEVEGFGGQGGLESLRVVAKTRRIPLDCVVVRSDLSRALAQHIRSLLLSVVDRPRLSLALQKSWGMNGFVRPTAMLYDKYNQIAEVNQQAKAEASAQPRR